jgi:hypothetical protein
MSCLCWLFSSSTRTSSLVMLRFITTTGQVTFVSWGCVWTQTWREQKHHNKQRQFQYPSLVREPSVRHWFPPGRKPTKTTSYCNLDLALKPAITACSGNPVNISSWCYSDQTIAPQRMSALFCRRNRPISDITRR